MTRKNKFPPFHSWGETQKIRISFCVTLKKTQVNDAGPKMRKRNRKIKYDPFETLRAARFDPCYEDATLELLNYATKGSLPIWDKLRNIEDGPTPELRKEFLKLSHSGMRKAQDKIIEIITSPEPWQGSNTLLLHGIADSMAWQMIQNQLCYARRFYKEQPIIDTKHSNFESLLGAVNYNNESLPDSFSLISDLTTFIQVGDLLLASPEGGFTIVEVKEGEKNHQILDFMKFFMKSGCPRSLHYFVQEHGEGALKQLQRMIRQATRMGHVSEVLVTGRSEDPDTEYKIRIPEEKVYIGDWDSELNSILHKSDTRGWALDVIDDCLFIASYSRTAMRGGGHILFNGWFDNLEGTPDCPRTTLISCMSHPLALPIFNRNIADRHKLDILFGRKNVCIALNIPKLFKQLIKHGINVREASNKEASKMDQKGLPPYRFKGKAYFVGVPGREMVLMDGVFLRILYHSQRPINTIESILAGTTIRIPEAF
ncbi:hypothetical protein AB3464_03905 [Pseudomonas asplenii]|uniref:hypothetical protein n=1 Tax=Pseudomonas asplenii TaxID=53407 RepID=UPI0037C55449